MISSHHAVRRLIQQEHWGTDIKLRTYKTMIPIPSNPHSALLTRKVACPGLLQLGFYARSGLPPILAAPAFVGFVPGFEDVCASPLKYRACRVGPILAEVRRLTQELDDSSKVWEIIG